QGLLQLQLSFSIFALKAKRPTLHRMCQRVVGVFQQSVLRVPDRFFVMAFPDLQACQFDIDRRVRGIGFNRILVSADSQIDFPFPRILLGLVNKGLWTDCWSGCGDKKWGGGWNYHLVYI